MGLITLRCRVSQQPVSCVTDMEGATVRVICGAFEEAGGICRIKRRIREGGPLSQLLDRISDQTLDTRSMRCELA